MGNCKPEPATFYTKLRPQFGVLRPATERQKPATAGFCFKVQGTAKQAQLRWACCIKLV